MKSTDLKPKRLTKACAIALKDEQVLAAIIAGGESSGRKVLPSEFADRPYKGHNGFGVLPCSNQQGPCCAVGAGVLYGGATETLSPRDAFAQIHGVSMEYASGVSDGFENDNLYKHVLNGKGDDAQAEYDRGVAVGEAVWDYFYGSEDGTTDIAPAECP